MATSLSFYFLKNEKLTDSLEFGRRVSSDLVIKANEIDLNPFQKLFKVSSNNPALVDQMDSHRFEKDSTDWELRKHETAYEPFNEEWIEKKEEIIRKNERMKNIPYPKAKEVQAVFKDIVKLLSDTKESNEISNLSYQIGIDLENDYPVNYLIDDFQSLINSIRKNATEQSTICWAIM